jgi:hypothetical protein
MRARRLPGTILLGLVCMMAVTGRAPAAADRAAWPKAIEDNSFFLEEAYNQEDHVVQHISTLTTFIRPGVDHVFSFTQEWPAGGQRHQLSYTIPWLAIDSPDASGPGEVLINYRYQWVLQQNGAALAPRLSIVLPTLDEDLGVSRNGLGAQINLPLSWRLARAWSLHANAGYTLLPGVSPVAGGTGGERTLQVVSGGASLIWLLRSDLNLMFETFGVRAEEIDDAGLVRREGEVVVSPGLRLAIDRQDLQVVPGVALPVRFNDGDRDLGLFLYLSFEHPYGR